MNNIDQLNFEILEDGTLKVTTDKISAANHMNAEALLKDTATALGGAVDRQRKGLGEHHHHHQQEHKH